ncbi:uncharacterized protein UHOD_07027 [Ustilago sp. UG-2017b]|nr:uncharacterized protein UHOD_07027 [Ustilago sp. UG-2017b]
MIPDSTLDSSSIQHSLELELFPSDAFAGISTPPLPSSPTQLAKIPAVTLSTASNPIMIPDSTLDSWSIQRGLELELFPSGQPRASSLRSTNTSRSQLPLSTFELDPARLSDPASQRDIKATQFLRDEWLISAGQKEPDDLVDNYVSFMRNGRPESTGQPSSKRGGSSLLDQIDAICSPSSSGSSVQADGKITDARQPLRPSKSAKTNGKARATAEEIDKMVADDMFNTSCSPPSPPVSRIKSISDMPAEEQQFFYRLAFGGGSSSSSSPGNVSVTSRGKNGKTWQTTWDNSNQPSTGTVSLAATSRPNLTSGSSSSRGVAKGSTSSASSGAIRGRKPSAFTVEARKGSRGGKARSSTSSSSSAHRSRSRFFS